MAFAKAVTKHVRVPPRKARLAAGLIRNLSVADAKQQLQACGLKAGRILSKTLDSAVANAENNQNLRREQMQVLEVRVDGGPHLKRSKPRSKGSRHPVLKRTSHFTVVVGAKE